MKMTKNCEVHRGGWTHSSRTPFDLKLPQKKNTLKNPKNCPDILDYYTYIYSFLWVGLARIKFLPLWLLLLLCFLLFFSSVLSANDTLVVNIHHNVTYSDFPPKDTMGIVFISEDWNTYEVDISKVARDSVLHLTFTPSHKRDTSYFLIDNVKLIGEMDTLLIEDFEQGYKSVSMNEWGVLMFFNFPNYDRMWEVKYIFNVSHMRMSLVLDNSKCLKVKYLNPHATFYGSLCLRFENYRNWTQYNRLIFDAKKISNASNLLQRNIYGVNNLNHIQIIPNPVINKAKVLFSDGKKPRAIEFYSLNGILIQRFDNINSQEIDIQIKDYPSGGYILRINMDDKVFNRKLTKQ
ncbi:MAG: T9SS type A sorting domain-containing protein [Elusimicrobiota bacterium]